MKQWCSRPTIISTTKQKILVSQIYLINLRKLYTLHILNSNFILLVIKTKICGTKFEGGNVAIPIIELINKFDTYTNSEDILMSFSVYPTTNNV